ncbi:MAG: hypothetical protein HZA01_06970 [Nitrospinae bacterium]|nr:hypothetical protein [Nitrospinota bacterium]
MPSIVAVKCAFTSPLIPLEKGELVVTHRARGFFQPSHFHSPLEKGARGM